MIIVSACLAGKRCSWDGKDTDTDLEIKEMVSKGEAIALCPEVLGGLDAPRKPCGIFGGVGQDVLEGKAKVKTVGDGEDRTIEFVRGADEVLKIARSKGIRRAILKTPSPSCGCGKVWQLDSNLQNHRVDGDGITAALLKKNGIEVVSRSRHS